MKKKIAVSFIVLLIISIVSFLFFKFNNNDSEKGNKNVTFTEIKKDEAIEWDPTDDEDVKKHITIKDKKDSDIPYNYKTVKINKNEYEIKVNAKDENGEEISKKYVVKTKEDPEVIDDEEKVDPEVYKDVPLVDGQPGNYDNKDGKLKIPKPIVVSELGDIVTPEKKPEGFKFLESRGVEDVYLYNRKLSSGGYIDKIYVSIGSVLFDGKDNKGRDLSVSYTAARDELSIIMNSYSLTDDDFNIMYELGEIMSEAYGKQMLE